jgi:hypothetical protein
MDGAQVRAWSHNTSSPTPPFTSCHFHDFQALPKDFFFKRRCALPIFSCFFLHVFSSGILFSFK